MSHVGYIQDECDYMHPEHGIHIKSGAVLCCYYYLLGTCDFSESCRKIHRSVDQIEAKKKTCLFHKKDETMGQMIINTPRKRSQFQSLQNLHEFRDPQT